MLAKNNDGVYGYINYNFPIDDALTLPINDGTMSKYGDVFNQETLQYMVAGCILRIPTYIFTDNDLASLDSIEHLDLSMASANVVTDDVSSCHILNPHTDRVAQEEIFYEYDFFTNFVIMINKDSQPALDLLYDAIDYSEMSHAPTVDIIIVFCGV